MAGGCVWMPLMPLGLDLSSFHILCARIRMCHVGTNAVFWQSFSLLYFSFKKNISKKNINEIYQNINIAFLFLIMIIVKKVCVFILERYDFVNFVDQRNNFRIQKYTPFWAKKYAFVSLLRWRIAQELLGNEGYVFLGPKVCVISINPKEEV